MTLGLPGSGKSTWAREYQQKYPETVLVNKDELRAMLHQSVHSKARENYVLKVRDSIIEKALADGKTVIVHDTNFHESHPARLKELAAAGGAQFEVRDFTHVPLEECIRRDQKRANYVGEKVIKKMYKQYLQPKPGRPDFIPGKPFAIICDLDGTLCLYGDANPYERDFTKDAVNEPVFKTIDAFLQKGYKIIFVSGRKDKFEDQTREWLAKNWGADYQLYMRKTQPDGVEEPKDVVVKAEIYNQYIKGQYNVLLVLDDRDQVVEFWRSQGLTVFQVAEGDF